MRSKITRSTVYKLFAILCVVFLGIFGMRYVLKAAFFASRSTGIDTVTPMAVISSLLEVHIDFNNGVGTTGAMKKFAESIDRAKYSVEIAVFSLRSDTIRRALYKANARGVKVTLILDSSRKDQHDYVLAEMPSGIERIDSGVYDAEDLSYSSFMHHKYMIVDRGYPGAELTSGSLNFTDVGEKYNQSYFFTTSDSALVTIFGNEFDLLKSGVTGLGKLSKREYDPWTANLSYSNGFFEVWMSPGFSNRSVKYRILELIDSATSSLDLMVWDFTDESIARKLIAKSEKGIPVRVIAENSNATSTYSAIPFLVSSKASRGLTNLEIILDTKSTDLITESVPDGFNPYLHEHTMIVDGHTVVFGTNNWSLRGFYHNDEDTIVTDNAYLVGEFQKTFDFFYRGLR